jgi:hypothetical protein
VIAYADASVMLRLALGQAGALAEWRSIDGGVVSALVEVECLRTLDRFRHRTGMSDPDLAERREAIHRSLERFTVVDVSPDVLARAGEPFPTLLGTLDSIHLASALLWRERTREALVFATHDEALAIAARAHGFEVVGSGVRGSDAPDVVQEPAHSRARKGRRAPVGR